MLPLYVSDRTVRVLDASPEPPSLKSVRLLIAKLALLDVLVEPPGLEATLFTVSAPPLGAVESLVNVSVGAAVVLPTTSAPVTTSVGEEVVPSVQENTFESYGPPDGVLTVLGVCDQPLLVPPSVAVALDAGPVPLSVNAFRILKRASGAAARAAVVDRAARLEGAGRRRLRGQRKRVRRPVLSTKYVCPVVKLPLPVPVPPSLFPVRSRIVSSSTRFSPSVPSLPAPTVTV